jgi:DNA-binding transcriptional LysR family regulator
MDLRQLECFLAVARHLHFGRAAEEMHLGQPTVSDTVRRLELELGAALFDRTTRRVTLTEFGEAFLPEAEAAYNGVIETFNRARERAVAIERRLVVGYTDDLGGRLVDVCTRVQRACPGVIVELRQASSAGQLRRLNRRQLQAAIVWGAPSDEDLEVRLIGSSGLVAVVPERHRFAADDSVSAAELASEPLIAWPRATSPTTYDAFTAAMDEAASDWTLVGVATGLSNVASRVLSGYGVAVMLGSLTSIDSDLGVVAVPIVDLPSIEQFVVWRSDERHEGLERLIDELSGPSRRR